MICTLPSYIDMPNSTDVKKKKRKLISQTVLLAMILHQELCVPLLDHLTPD